MNHGTRYSVFPFYFLFRSNLIREQLDENDFRCCYDNFYFESVVPKVPDHGYFQSSFSRITGTLTTAFERHLTIKDFTDMDQHRCQACTKTFDLLLHAFLFLKQA